MEFDFSRTSWSVLIAAPLAFLITVAIFGARVTPLQAGEPALLSPDRWTAARLARQAQAEAQALIHDASQLRRLLEANQPDPVAAMLLAQRLYANHRQGTSATGGARQALIVAGGINARYTVGELSRQAAISALNDAFDRIEPLVQKPAEAIADTVTAGYELYFPLVQTESASQSLGNRPVILPRTRKAH